MVSSCITIPVVDIFCFVMDKKYSLYIQFRHGTKNYPRGNFSFRFASMFIGYCFDMKDLPQIPFIRELMKGASEEEIKEAEYRMHQLCLWLQKTEKG